MYSIIFNQIKINLKLKKKIFFLKNTKKTLIVLNILLSSNLIIGYVICNDIIRIYGNQKYDYNLMKNFFSTKNFRIIKYKNLIKMQNVQSLSNYIYSTNKGLLNSNQMISKKTGGVLLFKI